MRLTAYVFVVLVGGVPAIAVGEAPQTIGWIERVGVYPANLVLNAKIDTGADNSSIHADDIQVRERDGVKRVAFTLHNKRGQAVVMEKPLVRYATIKRKGAEALLRPVVAMELCVGNTLRKTEVNLANRENFRYQMLIGRSYLKQAYLVDSNRIYTAEPACAGDVVASSPSSSSEATPTR